MLSWIGANFGCACDALSTAIAACSWLATIAHYSGVLYLIR